MKIKDECVFSALEGRSRRMVGAERHDKWRVFHETARSSGRGACSPQRHRQCPGGMLDGQRQGATAAARRDEGVTLRPRLYGGPASRRPFPFLGPPLACIKHRGRHPDPAAASKMQISQRLSSSIRLYASHGMLFRHNPSCLRLIVGAERNPSYLQLLIAADQTGSPHSQNSIGCREMLSIVFAAGSVHLR